MLLTLQRHAFDVDDHVLVDAASLLPLSWHRMGNVAVQLAKLQEHPVAGPALACGRVQATGLFYDIATARVLQITADSIESLDPAFVGGLRTAAVSPCR